jgi:hypothetical protein
MAGAATQQNQRDQTRLALGAMLIPIFFVAMFALCIIGVYHTPHPNGIKLAVVGPPAQTAQLRAGIEEAAGSAFDVSAVPTGAQAARDVRQRDLDAAFVPARDPQQPATLIVARAGGRIVATAVEGFARSVSARQGAQLAVRDVRPLPPGDAIGVGIFMFMIVCTICGYLAVTLLFTVAPDLTPRLPLRDHRGDVRRGADDRVPDRGRRLRDLHRLVRDDRRVHRGRRAVRIRDRPDHTPAPGAPRSPRAVRLARDLRVPEHPKPRSHLHARAAARLLALPQPLLDRSGDHRRGAQHPLLRRPGRRRPTCSCWLGLGRA